MFVSTWVQLRGPDLSKIDYRWPALGQDIPFNDISMTDRAQKNSTRHATNINHQRIPLDDDYEVVQARTSSLRWGPGLPVDSPRDELRGFTTWEVGTSWAPEDDPEFNLDKDSEQHDRELETELGTVLDRLDKWSQKESAKKKRSEASVSNRSTDCSVHILTSF